MFTIKKLTLLLTFLILATSTLALSLDFNETTLGTERELKGNILLPANSYDKTSQIKISVDSDSDSKSIQELINCTSDSNCQKETSGYYTYTTETPEISESNFLTGIKLKKGSQINEAAHFWISYYDGTNYPQEPSIDVGNDGTLEWFFKGEAPSTPDWTVNTFAGPAMISQPENLVGPTGACQNIFLNKTNKIKVRACLKGADLSSTVMHIFGKETEMTDSTPEAEFCSANPDFTTKESILTLTQPLEDGNYKVCITASSDVTLAENTSSQDPQAYRCTSSSCSKKPTSDYIIQAKSSDFILTLENPKEYLESNTNPGTYFKDAIGDYFQTCTFDNNYCIIPINISTKNNQKVRVYDLSYTETESTGDSYDRYKFLYGMQDQGSKTLYKTTSQKTIPLSDFDLTSPSEIGNYTLTLEYGSDTISVPLRVIPAPAAKANVSIKLAPTKQTITFDASNSESESDLTYYWDFGDNSTSNLKITTHTYLLQGIYKVTLTVTDQNQISDDYKLNVEIYSEEATQQLITNTISRLEALRDKYLNSNQDIKDTYIGLEFEKRIEDYTLQLSTSPTLTESEVNSILNEIPTSINIINKVSITPYLSSAEIDELYGFETESYRTTLQELNSKFQTQVTARLISLSYPTQQESFILVKKTITTPQSLQDVSIIEIIPTTLAPSQDSLEFLDSFPETTRLQDHQSAKFTIPNFQDSFTFYYKLQGNNLDAIKDTISIVMPQDLSPSLIPFNCGDGICNPAEDSISCPEDCHCGNNKCEPGESKSSCPEDCAKFPWLTVLIVLVILAGGGFLIYKFKIYEKLKLGGFIDNLTSKFQKSPYKSGTELSKVRSYIKDAMGKGYAKEKISDSLLQSGWSQSQVKHAFKKLKKKKQ